MEKTGVRRALSFAKGGYDVDRREPDKLGAVRTSLEASVQAP